MVERIDAVVDSLGQERFADITVEPFLFPPPFRLRELWRKISALNEVADGPPRPARNGPRMTVAAGGVPGGAAA